MREECGVFGICNKKGQSCSVDLAQLTYYGLFALQHRGQESCGIAISRDNSIYHYKDMGLVPDVMKRHVLDQLKDSNIAMGHVRYSTTGGSNPENAQPLFVEFNGQKLAMAHNGNLSNSVELRKHFIDNGAVFHTTNDSELITIAIANENKTSSTVEDAIQKSMSILEGAYSLVLMTPEKLIAARDPYGFRPLCLGERDDAYVFASETAALDIVGAKWICDIAPGEIITIENGDIKRFGKAQPIKHTCEFEYIYFARPDSKIDDISVYESRVLAGHQLAKEHPVNADLVIGVPDGGIPSAIGFAEKTGIKYGVGLIKNKYIGRTFIAPTQEQRENGVLVKLNALKDTVAGKRIVMVDDSLVHGTTCKRIVKLLKEAGAKEVHVRISSPRFIAPCYYGTDVSTNESLMAAHKSIDEMRKTIEADSLGFLSIDALPLLTKNRADMDCCKGCFTGKYPDKNKTSILAR